MPRVVDPGEVLRPAKPPSHYARISEAIHVVSIVLLSACCAWIMGNVTWFFVPIPTGQVIFLLFIVSALVASGPVLATAASIFAIRKERLPHKYIRIFTGSFVTSSFLILFFFIGIGQMDRSESNSSPLYAAFFILISRLFIGLIDIFLVGTAVNWNRERCLQLIVISSVCCTPLTIVCWSLANIPLVAWSAYATAGPNAYCLQLGKLYSEYKPVDHITELSGFKMQAPFSFGGVSAHQWQFTFHALLVVKKDGKNSFYNWSYYDQTFVPFSERTKSLMRPIVKCEPRTDFISSLSVF